MPFFALVEKVNVSLTQPAVQALLENSPELVEQLHQPGSLTDVAQQVFGLEAEEQQYLEDLPTGVREAMRAGIADAMNRGYAIQASYSPAYDFAVEIREYGEALRVHVEGPYTGAPYPKESYSPKS